MNDCDSLDDAEILATLTQIKGIGRWTVEMFLIFNLGRQDVLPVHDLGVRRGFQVACRKRNMPSPEQLEKYGFRWAPHRSLAARYLWRAADSAENPNWQAKSNSFNRRLQSRIFQRDGFQRTVGRSLRGKHTLHQIYPSRIPLPEVAVPSTLQCRRQLYPLRRVQFRDATDGQMRLEGPVFASETECQKTGLDGFLQVLHRLQITRQSCPEDAGPARIWETSQSRHANVAPLVSPASGCKRGFDFGDAGRLDCSQEMHREMDLIGQCQAN